MAFVRHDVFDEAVRPTASRQIGNNAQRAAADHRLIDKAAKATIGVTGDELLPHGLDKRAGGQGGICRVEMRVELEKPVKIGESEPANQHASHPLTPASHTRSGRTSRWNEPNP